MRLTWKDPSSWVTAYIYVYLRLATENFFNTLRKHFKSFGGWLTMLNACVAAGVTSGYHINYGTAFS